MKHFIIAAVLLVAAASAFAQNDGYSPRTIGMARTFSASSRGFDALGLNPANLAFSEPSTSVTFTIVPPVGVRFTSDFFTLDLINNYFTAVDSLDAKGNPTGNKIARQWTKADEAAIIGRMSDGLSHTKVNVNAMLFGAVINAGSFGIGVSVTDHIGATIELPDDYLKLMFYGLEPEGSKYDFSKTAVRSLWYREYNVSTGFLVPIETKAVHNVAVGIGVKMIQGFNYVSTTHNNSGLVSTSLSDSMKVTLTSDLEAVQAGIPLDSTAADNIMHPGGKGFGVDIGVSAELMSGLRVGASMLNIGSIKWSGENNKRIVNHGTYTWAASKYDSAELHQVGDKVDSLFTSKKYAGEDFTSKLPTSLHIGASLDMKKFIENFPLPLNLAADFHFGMNDEPGNYSSTLVGLGAELNLLNGWLPIRTGVILGGPEKALWSGGIGFHFFNSFDIDLATESMSVMTAPKTFKTVSVILGMKVRI
jgi:hypothetical protein